MEVRQRATTSHPEEHSDNRIIEPSSNEECPVEDQHVPIRILEKRILSFTQTTVPHALGRLRQHRENMVQLHQENDWSRLNSEQVNANRTVQQLKSHIRTLDELRHQVEPKDLPIFNKHTHHIRTEILVAIEEYGMVKTTLSKAYEEMEERKEDNDEQTFDDLTSVSDQSVLIPQQEPAVESWDELRKELIELNELVKVLQSEVKVQNRSISHVHSQVDSAATRVALADAQLQGTSRVKAYLLPVGGALVGGLVGGAVGGPIGAIAGFKAGAITAAAAGTAGVIGGAFVGFKAKMFTWRRTEIDNGDPDKLGTTKKTQ